MVGNCVGGEEAEKNQTAEVKQVSADAWLQDLEFRVGIILPPKPK